MSKRKKFIIGAVLLVAVIAGTIGGVAIAQPGGPNGGDRGAAGNAMLERVAEIYEENTNTAIDVDELQNAMTQAREEIAAEQREQRRQKLVEEGIITQEQLDELEAWLDARPDSVMSDEFKEWLEDRPDIGLGHGDGEGFGKMREHFGQRGQGGPGGGFGGSDSGFHGSPQSGNDL